MVQTTNADVVKGIVAKARAYQKQVAPNGSAKVSTLVPVVTFPDPMNSIEAALYLRVSKTTLMEYEKHGFLKANRIVIPNKTRGKVMWSKVELDKIRFPLLQNN